MVTYASVVSKSRIVPMKRHIIPVILLATLLSSCGKESKTPDKPSSSPPVQPSVARQPAIEPSSDSENGKHALGDYVSFPASGIKIRHPEGFEKADSFDGFGQAETQSSVLVISLAGPYSKVTAGLTQEKLKARGWTLHSKEDVKVDGLPGILIHFEQPAIGKVFLKWSFVSGDEKKTTMVTATFPKSHERELSARLKSAVLSARIDRSAPAGVGANLPFTVAPSKKLKLTPVVSNTLGYTKDGVIPVKSPKDPLFMVAPSLGKVVVEDKRQFAERNLRESAGTKELVVKSTDAITIAGLDGYESLAEAEDAKSGTALIVYQVILFDEDSFILLKGYVGTELRDEYLPQFKAMARSLQKKKP